MMHRRFLLLPFLQYFNFPNNYYYQQNTIKQKVKKNSKKKNPSCFFVFLRNNYCKFVFK